jgi:hypothetical protein
MTRSEQARINGAKSKGPKTDEGRARCGQVNLTHGAYAATITVLPNERPEDYAMAWAAAHDQYRPANAYEALIVGNIVDHLWNHRRLVKAANDYVRMQMERMAGISPSEQDWQEIHLRAEADSKHIELLERRARHHAREHTRAVKALEEARKQTTSTTGSQNYQEAKDLIVEELAAVIPIRPARPMETALWPVAVPANRLPAPDPQT